MALDSSIITGAVNNYLNSISDTNKLLMNMESKDASTTGLEGIFEKYLTKAIQDETEKAQTAEGADKAVSAVGAASNTEAVKAVDQTGNAIQAEVRSHMREVDTSIPFPDFDIENTIKSNMASHSRFDFDIFSQEQHVPQREVSNKSVDPFYSNMISSSIYDAGENSDDDGFSAASIESRLDAYKKKAGTESLTDFKL